MDMNICSGKVITYFIFYSVFYVLPMYPIKKQSLPLTAVLVLILTPVCVVGTQVKQVELAFLSGKTLKQKCSYHASPLRTILRLAKIKYRLILQHSSHWSFIPRHKSSFCLSLCSHVVLPPSPTRTNPTNSCQSWLQMELCFFQILTQYLILNLSNT